MGANSHIEWTHHTFNPWRGCTKVSQGCKNCYAEKLSERNPGVLGIWGPQGSRPIASESYWKQPIKWDRDAQAEGVRKRAFCASLADIFEGYDTMPKDAWADVEKARLRLWALIQDTPWLDWLLLTKRPQNVDEIVPQTWLTGFPDNVWIGTSVEDQATADERIPHLLQIPAKVRFLSMEPLIGAVNIECMVINLPEDRYYSGFPGTYNALEGKWTLAVGDVDKELANVVEDLPKIHWVIVGGESGRGARPMHPDWVRSLRDQCVRAGVPFFFKQWGEWVSEFHPEWRNTLPQPDAFVKLLDGDYEGFYMGRVGKAKAGRILDGRTWDEFPEVSKCL